MEGSPHHHGLSITAFAVCSALGATTRDTFEGLLAARSGLRAPALDVPFDTVVGSIPTMPPMPASWRAYDSPVARVAMHLLDEITAEVDAAVARWGADRVAVIVGTSVGGLRETESALARHGAGLGLPDGYDLRRTHSLHALVDATRLRCGIRGPGYAVSTACSSGAKVFASAQRLIELGVVDAAVVGGVDSLCLTTLHGFHALGILSAGACRPFAAGRDGTSLGEGGALFLLEREGHARARLLGVGEGTDGHHMSAPHPAGLGSRDAMTSALARAGIAPSTVDCINAHGTGTAQNDLVECEAIADLFGPHVPVTSTKGATGHCLGAAGAIEAALAVASLERSYIPASLGASPLDPAIGVSVALEGSSRPCKVVMSNSFGFGGSNVSVILGAP